MRPMRPCWPSTPRAARVALDLSAESVDRWAWDGQRRHRQPPPPVFGGGGQFEAELADLSVEFADLAAQPLDVGGGGQVDPMQDPRRHAVEGGGDGGAGLGEDRAEFGVVARADERFQPGGETLLDRVVRLVSVRGTHVTRSDQLRPPQERAAP